MTAAEPRPVLVVSGTDRPGIVTAISKVLTDFGANIVTLDQYSTDPQGGEYFQRTEFNVPDFAGQRAKLESTLTAVITNQLGLDWYLDDLAAPKRVIILASITEHNLLDLLWRQRRGELRTGVHTTHAATAAAGDGLGEERETDVLRLRHERVDVIRCLGGAQYRHSGLDRVALGLDLVAGHLEHGGGRADEDDARRSRFRRQLRVLGEETVPGVDGVGAALHRNPHDLIDVEIGAHGVAPFTDLVGLVRLESVDRSAVLPGEDGDGARTEFDGGAESTDGDLATVGDQDLGEHAHLFVLPDRVVPLRVHGRLTFFTA